MLRKDKKALILAQILISFAMALLMTGIFTAIPSGFAPGWVGLWLMRFLAAWPVAFLLSLPIGPVAFFLAFRIIEFAGSKPVAESRPTCETRTST